MIDLTAVPTSQPWLVPATYWPRLAYATRELDPPYGGSSSRVASVNSGQYARGESHG